jgi:hypothetical protein
LSRLFSNLHHGFLPAHRIKNSHSAFAHHVEVQKEIAVVGGIMERVAKAIAAMLNDPSAELSKVMRKRSTTGRTEGVSGRPAFLNRGKTFGKTRGQTQSQGAGK